MKHYLTKIQKIQIVFSEKTDKEIKRLATKLSARQIDYIYNQYCKRNRLIGLRTTEEENFYKNADLQYITR